MPRSNKSLIDEFANMDEACTLSNDQLIQLERDGLIETVEITQAMVDAGEHALEDLGGATGHMTEAGKALHAEAPRLFGVILPGDSLFAAKSLRSAMEIAGACTTQYAEWFGDKDGPYAPLMYAYPCRWLSGPESHAKALETQPDDWKEWEI